MGLKIRARSQVCARYVTLMSIEMGPQVVSVQCSACVCGWRVLLSDLVGLELYFLYNLSFDDRGSCRFYSDLLENKVC